MRSPAGSPAALRPSVLTCGGGASYPLGFADTVSLTVQVITIIALAACAPIEQRPPEQRTQTVTAVAPIAAPCFTEDERPVLAPLTVIDIDHATADQLAFALRADAINEDLFVKAVDAIFLKCLKPGGTK